MITLYTKNCIVTGKRAKIYTNYVLLRTSLNPDGVNVLAGFASETELYSSEWQSGQNWKAEDGLAIQIRDYDKVPASINSLLTGKVQNCQFWEAE